MPLLSLAEPVLEVSHMTLSTRLPSTAEPMVNGKHAAAALQVPYYWFSAATMRNKLRIPHYVLGGVIRYRLSELTCWAKHHQPHERTTICLSEITP